MSTSNTSPASPHSKGVSPALVQTAGVSPAFVQTAGVSPAFILTAGEGNILYRGRLLYPERGPLRFASRVAAAAEAGPARLYLIASPGLFHGVTELLAAIDGDSALLCVETDPELAAFSRAHLAPELASNPRLAFIEGADHGKLLAEARRLGAFRRAVLVRISGGFAFDEANYRGAAELIDGEFRALWRNRASLLGMGRLWTRNIFRNLAFYADIRFLGLPRTGKPLFVCGAGPSLESALPLLSAYRSSLFILAADTAIGTLLSSGIVPDLVICLEAQIWNLRDFLPLEGRPLALIADLSSHAATFRASGGPISLSRVTVEEGEFMRRLADSGPPALACPPLGSVGVHAVHIAALMARDKIFITGLDFTFETGKSHARGTPALIAEEVARSRLGSALAQASLAYRPGVRRTAEGELTDPVLSGYAALCAEEMTLSEKTFIDLRGRGLPLGAPRLTIDEAERILASSGPGSEPKPGSTPGDDGGEALRPFDGPAFLHGELDRLVAIEAALKGRSVVARDGLQEMILGSDFLLWPLPDRERLRDLPQDLLNRILVETEYWIWKLEELLGR